MDVTLIAATVLLLGLIAAYTWPRVVCPWREQIALRTLSTRTGLSYAGRRAWGVPRAGRTFGTYRGRACAVESHKELEIHRVMRIVCSVHNPSGRDFRLFATVRDPDRDEVSDEAHEALWVAQSTPQGFAERAIVAAGLAERIPPVAAGIRAPDYSLSLSGHLLRFECHPRGLCAMPADQAAEGLRAMLDALCACAESLEAMDPQRLPRADEA